MNELYNDAAIKECLRSYGQLDIATKCDIDNAIASKLINGSHSKMLFCLYAMELNVIDTCIVLNMSAPDFAENYVEMIEILEAVANGYKTRRRKQLKQNATNGARTLDDVLNLLDNGIMQPFEPMRPDLLYIVRLTLSNMLGDELLAETARQQIDGKPAAIQAELFNMAYDKDVYNIYTVDDAHELGMKRPSTGTDQLYKKDYQNNVRYENNFNFVVSKDLRGRKRTSFKSDDHNAGGKMNLY